MGAEGKMGIQCHSQDPRLTHQREGGSTKGDRWIHPGLVGVRGEKRDVGLWEGDLEAMGLGPVSYVASMTRQALRCCRDGGRGGDCSKVVRIRSLEVRCVWVIRDERN